jgi:hypothetical protein
MSSATTAIEILESMTLDERIAEVAKDVLSGTDRYKGIAADDLAALLDVFGPFDIIGWEWEHVSYVPPASADWVLVCHGTAGVLELLREALSPERIEQLEQATQGLDIESALSLFSADEQRAMVRLDQEYMAGTDCQSAVAYCEVRSAHGELLVFEVSVYDAGEVSDFRTPYDRRDGKFTDLTGCLICYGKPLPPIKSQS